MVIYFLSDAVFQQKAFVFFFLLSVQYLECLEVIGPNLSAHSLRSDTLSS